MFLSLQGYIPHIISTFCEWVLGLGFVCYYLTFFSEFWQIDIKMSMRLYAEPFPVINEDTQESASGIYT